MLEYNMRRNKLVKILAALITVSFAGVVTAVAGTADAAVLPCNTFHGAYVFDRAGGALGLGHVGWGYRNTCTGTFYYGSVENGSGAPHVDAGGDNGFWWQSGTESQMITAMRSKGYTAYKTILTTYASFNPDSATSVASVSAGQGYDVATNNCADNTWDILNALGVPDLPYLQLHPFPNDWYANLTDTVNVDWTLSTTL